MTALDGQDGACRSEVGLVGDELGSAEVGADTDTLKDVGDGKERWDVLEAEVVRALSDWSGTGT